jgi:hypothetical protein
MKKRTVRQVGHLHAQELHRDSQPTKHTIITNCLFPNIPRPVNLGHQCPPTRYKRPLHPTTTLPQTNTFSSTLPSNKQYFALSCTLRTKK